jgi:hypothetical protein
MKTHIDVLAVLDEFALYVRNVSSRHALQGDILEARAAVAEIIGFVQDCADGRPEAEPSECRKRAIDLLARIGGAS